MNAHLLGLKHVSAGQTGALLGWAMMAVLLAFQQTVFAGSGSKQVLPDGHSFKATYYTTEISATYSRINSISVDATVPGLRLFDEIGIQILVYSQGRLVWSSGERFIKKDLRPGISSASQRWNFSCNGVQVRRGNNQIKVTYCYNYLGGYQNFNNVIGTGSFSLVVP